MKITEFNSYRDIDRKYVKIRNVDEVAIKSLKIENLTEPFVGIIYLDQECGISLRILGDKNQILDEMLMIARYDAITNFDFEIFDGQSTLEEYLYEINDSYYTEEISELINESALDSFRHESFFNDVEAILFVNDGVNDGLEKIWVRLEMKTNHENIYVGKLLDTSYYDEEYSEGELVALVHYKRNEDEDEFLIINGLVRIEEDVIN
ncbi:MAG: hypothetical protein LUG60_01630 [Erysipelotrichaceae bacterium]|nr:hypothetical protein [Erysipelotrichaceae bacterium]